MIQTFFGTDPWVEGGVFAQAAVIAATPGVEALALMADAHPGRYGPVGMVCDASAVFPLWIGGDIGCGMGLFKLSKPFRKINLDRAVRLWADMDMPFSGAALWAQQAGLPEFMFDQLGTIGRGNHFLELQEVVKADPVTGLFRGDAVLLVHTGSRGHGQVVMNALPTAGQGLVNDQAAAYMQAHDRCVAFARENRAAVAARAAEALGLDWEVVSDTPHNLVEKVNGLWRHRKGAAQAGESGFVAVAGTRETPSWLVAPKSVSGALQSLPHGSGRKVDRSACHGRFRAPKREKDGSVRFSNGRVICGDKDLLVEEMGAAYKDSRKIAQAIEEEGLGDIVATLEPRLTFKVGI